jgi:hypothetical protein
VALTTHKEQIIPSRPATADDVAALKEYTDAPAYWLGTNANGFELTDVGIASSANVSTGKWTAYVGYGYCRPPRWEGGCSLPQSVTTESPCLYPIWLTVAGDRESRTFFATNPTGRIVAVVEVRPASTPGEPAMANQGSFPEIRLLEENSENVETLRVQCERETTPVPVSSPTSR